MRLTWPPSNERVRRVSFGVHGLHIWPFFSVSVPFISNDFLAREKWLRETRSIAPFSSISRKPRSLSSSRIALTETFKTVDLSSRPRHFGALSASLSYALMNSARTIPTSFPLPLLPPFVLLATSNCQLSPGRTMSGENCSAFVGVRSLVLRNSNLMLITRLRQLEFSLRTNTEHYDL